jgi:cell division protein FtsL
MDRSTVNSKIVSDEGWVEARRALLKKEKLYGNVAVVAALAIIIFAAPSVLDLQPRSTAQEQHQSQQQQTAYDAGKHIEDLSF